MKDGKGKFYRKLKLGKDLQKAIKLYRKFKWQVIRGAEFFDPNAPGHEREKE